MSNSNIREHLLNYERYVNRCVISLNVSLFLDLDQRDSHILRMDRKVVLGDTALALEQRWCAVAHNRAPIQFCQCNPPSKHATPVAFAQPTGTIVVE